MDHAALHYLGWTAKQLKMNLTVVVSRLIWESKIGAYRDVVVGRKQFSPPNYVQIWVGVPWNPVLNCSIWQRFYLWQSGYGLEHMVGINSEAIGRLYYINGFTHWRTSQSWYEQPRWRETCGGCGCRGWCLVWTEYLVHFGCCEDVG